MGTNDGDKRPVAKLVLLQQACCDKRLRGERNRNRGSHVAALAVIVDACYEKPRCYIGPSAIGKIAGLNEKTVRECIKDLEAAGYIRTEPRSERSKWIYPNFDHAESTGCLVSREGKELRVHRPALRRHLMPEIAGAETRCSKSTVSSIAGLGIHHSGSKAPRERVYRPSEAVKETIQEAVTASQLGEEQEKQRQQREERKAKQQQSVLTEYLECREAHPKRAAFMLTVFPYLAGMIEEKAA